LPIVCVVYINLMDGAPGQDDQ